MAEAAHPAPGEHFSLARERLADHGRTAIPYALIERTAREARIARTTAQGATFAALWRQTKRLLLLKARG